MRTSLVKWLCIVALFVAFVLWQWIADYESALRVVVCSGAAMVAFQAFHSAAFAVSLTKLKPLSIPSITDRNPGSESL